ncbi:MAG: DUF3275 family protein [Gammaproteobacteria bacterium]|nr:DUF3275 family protein [Gammaproteobacteria bacterium]MDH5652990.1 DUF3275 family protein [Gammaproteobacteria bacterium]
MNIDGVLSIKTIHGRNGPFNVGRLITDLGEFAVKDTLLEQYDEGRYEGNFAITQIFPSSYFAGGRFVVEVRATLKSLNLIGIDELKPDDKAANTEPDPADEQSQTVVEASDSSVQTIQSSEIAAETDDITLFGSLWPLGDQVKLDPTVDRKRFRDQRNRLRTLDYIFDALDQVWNKTGSICESQ